MVRLIEEFIRTLRASEVRVSVAEAIEANEAVATIGFADRTLLKNALALILAKTVDEKRCFSESFDLFFSRDQFADKKISLESQGKSNFNEKSTGNELADMLLSNDREGLAIAIERAAHEVGVTNIRFRTQVNFLTRRIVDRLGMAELEGLIAQSNQGEVAGGGGLITALKSYRIRLIDESRNFVERQFELYGRFAGQKLREEFLERTPLAVIDRNDHERMNKLIRRLARKLTSKYVLRRKKSRRGVLDVHRTLRANMAHEGIPFKTFWKQNRVKKPKIVAIVDVSRSVAASAKFLLLLLYNLHEILAGLKSFAFSSHLIDIENILHSDPIEVAIPKILNEIGFLPTNYGRALYNIKTEFPHAIDRFTTVIILGDARSNYSDPRPDIMKWIHQRARRVIWLNPEPTTFWGTGDSEMMRFKPYCHITKKCQTLQDLERVVDDIFRTTIPR